MSFLVAPILANSVWRVLLVVLLILVTLTAAIPLRVWRQMGWLLMLFFCAARISPDGLGVDYQPPCRYRDRPQPLRLPRTVPTGPVTVTPLPDAGDPLNPFVYPDLQHQPVSTHDCTRGNYRWD